jgi:hypothetical protein
MTTQIRRNATDDSYVCLRDTYANNLQRLVTNEHIPITFRSTISYLCINCVIIIRMAFQSDSWVRLELQSFHGSVCSLNIMLQQFYYNDTFLFLRPPALPCRERGRERERERARTRGWRNILVGYGQKVGSATKSITFLELFRYSAPRRCSDTCIIDNIP